MRKLVLALGCLIGLTTASFAQQKKVVADKIIGIVGDKIILYSDIQNAIADAARGGNTVPENAECAILEQALLSKVLMLQAMKDSLVVTDEEIEAELDQRVRYFIREYGTQEEVERLAGKSIYAIKDDARESVKERKLAETMQKKIVDNIKITPSEVKVYFDRVPKDSLPFFETELEIGQIVVFPKPSRDLEKYIIDELSNYKRQIEAKMITFAQAAQKYSEDPGSKDKGGQYQINRNEKSWDPTFVAAAFRLKEGEISPVIKTQFGYHIIQMVQRNGDDALIRHILRRDGDTYNNIDELDKDVVAMLSKIKIGEYSQPTLFTDERTGKKGVRILYLKSRSEPHRMNLRDDYNKISTAALEEKKYLALEKWMNAHIPNYYIMVDPEEASCPKLDKWVNAQKTYASN
jgi:peptidyl-prolyl cis-trans isomerase SurA